MKNNFNDYQNFFSSDLFDGIALCDAQKLCDCLGVYKKSYEKNSLIFSEGDETELLGFVAAGAVNVVLEDYWGNRAILAHIGTGGLFGEAFAVLNRKLPLNVIAAEKTIVLFINAANINTQCGQNCTAHSRLILNLMRILAKKNISLTGKIETISRKTLREKILMYLSSQSQLANNPEFSIPFNRQELADYLNADRSALSAELSGLSREGVIEFKKNKFKLIKLIKK